MSRQLRRRSLANLARMGHCAPTVMQTLLDASRPGPSWPVKLVAGLPGGIGNTGGECGGITAAIAVLGLHHAEEPLRDGVPLVAHKGHDLLRRFTACHGTVLCRAIRGDARLPLRCIAVIRRAPEQCLQSIAANCTDAIPASARNAYRRLHEHWCDEQFHCAHNVLRALQDVVPTSHELLAATSGFVGGTLFTGIACTAFTAVAKRTTRRAFMARCGMTRAGGMMLTVKRLRPKASARASEPS